MDNQTAVIDDNQEAQQEQQTQQQVTGDWTTSLPPEQKAVVGVKGWKAPGDVIKGYSELEKLVGHEKIAMPKKDALGNYEPGEFERVMSQLGLPKDPKEYKPSDTFKLPAGMALDEKFLGEFKARAHKAGVLPKQFAFVMDELAMIMNQGMAAKQATDKKAVDEAALALRGKWGLAYDAKSNTANNVLRNFAADQKSGEALAQKYGNDPLIIELLANVGENLNEESLSKVGIAGVLLSPEAAKLEIQKVREERSKELLDAGHPMHKFWVDKLDGLYRMAGA